MLPDGILVDSKRRVPREQPVQVDRETGSLVTIIECVREIRCERPAQYDGGPSKVAAGPEHAIGARGLGAAHKHIKVPREPILDAAIIPLGKVEPLQQNELYSGSFKDVGQSPELVEQGLLALCLTLPVDVDGAKEFWRDDGAHRRVGIERSDVKLELVGRDELDQ